MSEQGQIDEMRAVIRGDRERALARLQAEGREPLLSRHSPEERSAEQRLSAELAAGEPPAEPAVEVPSGERGEKPLVDELTASESGEEPVVSKPLFEPSRLARLRAIFRRTHE